MQFLEMRLTVAFLVLAVFTVWLVLINDSTPKSNNSPPESKPVVEKLTPKLVQEWSGKSFSNNFKGIQATCPNCGYVIDRDAWELHWYANPGKHDNLLNDWQKEQFARWLEKNPAGIPLAKEAMKDGVILNSEVEQIQGVVNDALQLKYKKFADQLLLDVLEGKPLPVEDEKQFRRTDPFSGEK